MDNLQMKINEILQYIKGENEADGKIDIESVDLAYKVLNEKDLSTQLACLRFFSAINLLNAYVKKDYVDKSVKQNYAFKKYIIDAIEVLKVNCPNGVAFGSSKDKVIYLSVYNLQFSFHSVLSKKSNLNLIEMQWQGVRLQPYALYIFKQAMSW